MGGIGKIFIIIGIIFIILGAFFVVGGRIPWLGKLPGDIYIKKEGVQIYIPITTSIIISLILTLLFRLLR
ncbi:hypothetical protein BBF96_06755 [Anoxybacter fermentans]|uniref:DUF2905 domain-containing protein n=1 Tax=Anoxybacter fermentans TaxID=1323375 RepID=A0A3S9T2V3_9FIRM|nr:hypothetical protein BBF96_06755 [Anoxybacter fermentans]